MKPIAMGIRESTSASARASLNSNAIAYIPTPVYAKVRGRASPARMLPINRIPPHKSKPIPTRTMTTPRIMLACEATIAPITMTIAPSMAGTMEKSHYPARSVAPAANTPILRPLGYANEQPLREL